MSDWTNIDDPAAADELITRQLSEEFRAREHTAKVLAAAGFSESAIVAACNKVGLIVSEAWRDGLRRAPKGQS